MRSRNLNLVKCKNIVGSTICVLNSYKLKGRCSLHSGEKIRNNLLLETDKYLLPDFPITAEQLEIVKEYRQALRDFPNNNYEIPEKPDFVITSN